MEYLNKVFFENSQHMKEVPNNSIDLIITSPPYFNVKDYSKNWTQTVQHSEKEAWQIWDIWNYQIFIKELLKVRKECERVLKPNWKLVINTPLMPMIKSHLNTHYNRHIFDINSDIQHSILYRKWTKMFLLDTYIWHRTNWSKKLMFWSYPYPRNFYAQNTSEFVTVYVKDWQPINGVPQELKEKSKLTQEEWVNYTKQIWDIPIPNKSDLAFWEHSAIMPEEIVRRCIKLYSFVWDVVLDPFTWSWTTLKVAKELERNYVWYEIMTEYKKVIDLKLKSA